MSSSKALIEYITQSIVEYPEQVEIIEKRYGRSTIYKLNVAPSDMGRVIGKQGRMANAIRALLRVPVLKSGEQVTLEIGK